MPVDSFLGRNSHASIYSEKKKWLLYIFTHKKCQKCRHQCDIQNVLRPYDYIHLMSYLCHGNECEMELIQKTVSFQLFHVIAI